MKIIQLDNILVQVVRFGQSRVRLMPTPRWRIVLSFIIIKQAKENLYLLSDFCYFLFRLGHWCLNH